MALLRVENLGVQFATPEGTVNALNSVSFTVHAGETLAIVGESGSGKSQAVLAILGLLARNGHASGSIRFNDTEILNLSESELNKIRAQQIAIIFQDSMTSLNPYMRVSEQLMEGLIHHKGLSRQDALSESIRMLDAVRIPDANKRIHYYPHEYSGGMRQRVVIAMALLCNPGLLIADEPTTSLDVTVQAQIMTLLAELQREFSTAIILITHDLGLVAGSCQDMLVMYGGRVMEYGKMEDVFENPAHPYTMGLLHAIPRLDHQAEELYAIPGTPPNMLTPLQGCPFQPRCDCSIEVCEKEMPLLKLKHNNHSCACHISEDNLI